ncbi:MAG: 6-bladed beta-propeller, partial [Chloroflexota bacterium]
EGTGNGQFIAPRGLAVDAVGNIYVADTGNRRVQKFDSSGNYLLDWGIEGTGNGQFIAPRGLAVDVVGNVYVVDTGNHRVQKFDSSGNYLLGWGSEGVGNDQFISPNDLTLDTSNNIYVVDTGNNRVQIFDEFGNLSLILTGLETKDGPLNQPQGLGISPVGHLYLADTGNHRIRFFTNTPSVTLNDGEQHTFDKLPFQHYDIRDKTPANWIPESINCNGGNLDHIIYNFSIELTSTVSITCTIVNTPLLPANLILGKETRPSDSQDFAFLVGFTRQGFARSTDIAVDSNDNMYVMDPYDIRIHKFDRQGNYLLSWGSKGTNNGQFESVASITVDNNDDVYITDRRSARVQKFDSDGQHLLTINVPASHVAIDTENNLYVTDQSQEIYKFDSQGNHLLTFGSHGGGDGQFSLISNIVVDHLDNVYVLDRSWNRVQKFDSQGNYLLKWGSSGLGDGQFNRPRSLLADPTGNIYVIDYSHRIQKFDGQGNHLLTFGQRGSNFGEFVIPLDIATNPSGGIYVLDTYNDRIQFFPKLEVTLADGEQQTFSNLPLDTYSIKETALDTWVLESVSCSDGALHPITEGITITIDTNQHTTCIFTNTNTSLRPAITIEAIGEPTDGTPFTFNHTLQPSGTFALSHGETRSFYGVSSGSYTVIADNSAPDFLLTNLTCVETGGVENSVVNLSAQQATINLDANELIHCTFTQAYNNLTLTKTTTPSIQTEFPLTVNFAWGEFGYGAGQFNLPDGVVIDQFGNIYIADSGNRRIQKFDRRGTHLLTWGGRGGSSEINPSGMAIDKSGYIYIADSINHRVQKFDSYGNHQLTWGSQGSDNGQFLSPDTIVVDQSGHVYVGDRNNYRIQKFDSQGNHLWSWGSEGSADGQFKLITGIAVDHQGYIYVSDTYDRIQKFDSGGNHILTWGSRGLAQEQFQSITDLAVDTFNNIYAVDSQSDRVQVFDNRGNFIRGWGDYGTGLGQFDTPTGIGIDSQNNIYVVDKRNNRIQYFANINWRDGEQYDFTTLPAQTEILIQETLPTNWLLEQVDCTGGVGAQRTAGGIILTLIENQHMSCTFTNTQTISSGSQLTSLNVIPGSQQNEIHWQINEGPATAGYWIMRRLSATDPFTPVNQSLILPTLTAANDYSYIDTTATEGASYYIREQDIPGNLIDHNNQPWMIVTANRPLKLLYLPIVLK